MYKYDDRQQIREIAKNWLSSDGVILDSETTGLDKDDEIIEIGVIDCSGKILLDTLVRSIKKIPPAVTKIHGITNVNVKNAPIWSDVQMQLIKVIKGRKLLIYNANFDCRLMIQSSTKAGIFDDEFLDTISINTGCVMLAYAHFYGEWNDYRNDYKWQKLDDAAKQQNVTLEGKSHRAITDCYTTLNLLKSMAGVYHIEGINESKKEASGKGSTVEERGKISIFFIYMTVMTLVIYLLVVFIKIL